MDDSHYPFRVNPHFKAWLPLTGNDQCFLLLEAGRKPVLLYHQEQDYWHKPATDPDGFWTRHFDIHVVASLREAHNTMGSTSNCVYIGDNPALAQEWNFAACNPANIVDHYHFLRPFKTDYEKRCILEANRIAARGHVAAREAFLEGMSEFEIQQAYLASIRHRERETPYSSIIATNENCGVLHYQHYRRDRLPLPRQLSMLIDAGADFGGYASDITRTYCRDNDSRFAAILELLDQQQLGIIDEIQPGMPYIDLHLRMHRRIAGILQDTGIVDASIDEMMESNLTFTFMPHGLGHYLGLQTHEPGGRQIDTGGIEQPPPHGHPALRITRNLEVDQIFTIEPGLYFIPPLLDELRASDMAGRVDWKLIEDLSPYGGIRIEDNICLQTDGPVNLTRPAFEQISSTLQESRES